MKKAFIIPNQTKDPELSVTARVIEKLQSLGLNCRVDARYKKQLPFAESFGENPEVDCDLIVVVGGDGSFLDASVIAIEMDIPIVGVNLGKVGYLAQIDPDGLDNFDKLSDGNYTVENKMLLEVCGADGSVCPRFAVNDVVISHNGCLGIAELKLSDSERNSVKFRSDGLVVATPQGSTAYSLSAGGPIIAHDVQTLTVTPVCPHSFFNRSVLFNSNEILTVQNKGQSELNIFVDGRLIGSLTKGQACRISKAKKVLHTISFVGNGMFTNLFRKIKVLEDIE